MIEIDNIVVKKINEILKNNDMNLYYIDQEQPHNDIHLMVYIRRNLGENVSLDDCVLIAKEINKFIDDYIDEEYVLEISSPGINRILYTKKHLEEVIGHKIEITLKKKDINTNQKKLVAKLEKVDEQFVYLNDENIPFNLIKKIRYIEGEK